MASKHQLQNLIQQIAALPEDEQAELLQSLVEMRGGHLGVYELDADERAALARSGDDMRHQRFASDQEIDGVFARHGA